MILRTWASRFRRQKTSISDIILAPKTRRKSIKTEVRKQMENQTLSGRHLCRFRDDFGVQDLPQNRPKTAKKSSEAHFGRKPELGRPRGRNLDAWPGWPGMQRASVQAQNQAFLMRKRAASKQNQAFLMRKHAARKHSSVQKRLRNQTLKNLL